MAGNTNMVNYWWRTKAFKVGLGVFAFVAVIAVIFFSEPIGQLLNLLGSRADTTRLLTVDGNPAQLEGHGYLGSGDFTDPNVEFVQPTDGSAGYVTLK